MTIAFAIPVSVTAQRHHQPGVGFQSRGLDLLLNLLLAKQLRARIEHVQVIGQAALPGDQSNVVGLLRRRHRLGGECLLLVHRVRRINWSETLFSAITSVWL